MTAHAATARPARRHRLGPAAAIPLGEGRAYAVGDTQVAVFRLRGGRLHAVGASCPHAGGPLADAQTDGAVLVCPLHQHVFELATGCSRSGQPPVPVYPVTVDAAGELIVHIPG
ncbi:MAG TPA: Rieske 2Fe-2S domain-containing protein [Mycobacteriales bacterium]|nr:Rieske 2Fe-2S domain-containing protein [Mycobacteriales bacterium]